MAIIGIWEIAQPKKGTLWSSRFITKTIGGKTSCSMMVSHADMCLASTIAGPAGMLAAPSSRYGMPSTCLMTQIMIRAQPRMILCRSCGRNGKVHIPMTV